MHRVVKNEFKEYENFGIKGHLMFRHKNKGYENLHWKNKEQEKNHTSEKNAPVRYCPGIVSHPNNVNKFW